MPRTNENYLRWQFGRYARQYAPNVTMLDLEGTDVELESGEHAIALVGLASGPPLVVTDARLIQAGETVARYSDVSHCDWIARREDIRDLDTEAQRKLKASGFDRLILALNDGRDVVVEGLGQAAFPLLKFFWFKLGRYRRE